MKRQQQHEVPGEQSALPEQIIGNDQCKADRACLTHDRHAPARQPCGHCRGSGGHKLRQAASLLEPDAKARQESAQLCDQTGERGRHGADQIDAMRNQIRNERGKQQRNRQHERGNGERRRCGCGKPSALQPRTKRRQQQRKSTGIAKHRQQQDKHVPLFIDEHGERQRSRRGKQALFG